MDKSIEKELRKLTKGTEWSFYQAMIRIFKEKYGISIEDDSQLRWALRTTTKIKELEERIGKLENKITNR